MTEEAARTVVAWRYEPPYDFYNLADNPEVLAELLDGSYEAAWDAEGDVAAFFCTGLAAQVPDGFRVGAYDNLDGVVVDLGLGMRPDLTGRGLGQLFIEDVMGIFRDQHLGAWIRLTVAAHNERAFRLYRRMGFAAERQFESHGVTFYTMRRALTAPPTPPADQEGDSSQHQQRSPEP